MQPNYAPPVQYPPAPAYPQPGYPPQYVPPTAAQFPGYPPQGFPQQPPQPPAQPLARGSLDAFYSQPSAGGSPALKFPVVGTRYIGIVERPINDSDVQQQTDFKTKAPLYFSDGRAKFDMRVPLQMQPQAGYPDGRGTWFVKGADRDELNRAMAEAGAPEGTPEHGSIIDITYTNDQQSGQGMNPRKVKAVVYTRPNGAGPVAPPVAAAPAQVQQPTTTPEGVAQAMAAQAAQITAAQQFAANVAPPGVIVDGQAVTPAQADAMLAAPAVPQAPVQPAAAPAPPPEMSAAQQELLAKLSGQTG